MKPAASMVGGGRRRWLPRCPLDRVVVLDAGPYERLTNMAKQA